MDKLDLILDKLDTLEAGQVKLEEGQEKLWAGQVKLEEGQEKLWAGQVKLEEGQEKLWAGQASLENGLRETNQIVRAIRDRQDETDAKLDAVSMDVHYLIGKSVETDTRLDSLTSDLRREMRSGFRRLEGHALLVDQEHEVINARLDKLESASR